MSKLALTSACEGGRMGKNEGREERERRRRKGERREWGGGGNE